MFLLVFLCELLVCEAHGGGLISHFGVPKTLDSTSIFIQLVVVRNLEDNSILPYKHNS